MALNKLKFNSLNVTPVAGKTVGFNSSANGLEATLSGGSMRFIKKLTASSSATLSFVNGSSDVVLDSTYKEYIFILNNMHPQTSGNNPKMTASTNTGSSYGVTATTTDFRATHNEAGSSTSLEYRTATDLAQSTDPVHIFGGTGTGNENDECSVGIIHLFNPSSTTFVKHFIARTHGYSDDDRAYSNFSAGYFNTTSAIDAIQFANNSGNIDAGTITLYGIN